MDDRKKIAEWARKNSYCLVLVISPLPSGERFGYNIHVRNVPMDEEIKLGVAEDTTRAKLQAERCRAFFAAPVKVEGTEDHKCAGSG